MSPEDIDRLRQSKMQVQKTNDILSRHYALCKSYETLQRHLKDASQNEMDLSDHCYIKTKGWGYGLWQLTKTKAFRKVKENHYRSWCGRHDLYLSPFYTCIHIRLSR